MRRKINVQLVSISIIAIVATMLVMLFVFYDLFQTQVQDDLRANAIVLKNTGIFHSGNENALHMDYRKLRVTWISATGTVLYDNDADVGTMDNHMSRPEVKHAFKDGDGNAVRKSATMDTNTFYYAIKLNDGSILRVAREASNIWSVCGKILPIVAATILIMMILCIILAHIMTKNIIKPIEQMAVDLDDFSVIPAYKELEPFAATIRAQHTDILKSARMRQDFTANVSHELKTPLTAISGYAELMENGMVPSEEIGTFCQKIEKSAVRKAASPRGKAKGSTEYIIFPYYYSDGELKRYEEKSYKEKFPFTYAYLESYKETLDERDADKNAQWFEYGRSQALTHINQNKILISTVITGKIRAYPLETDEIPYSGLFITVKNRPDALPLTEAMAILNSPEFLQYLEPRGINARGKSIRIIADIIANYCW